MSSEKIIYIADPEILSIPIIEGHEPLIDLKSQTILKYGPVPENELTKNCYTKLRKTVYEKLCQAQTDLPNGWCCNRIPFGTFLITLVIP